MKSIGIITVDNPTGKVFCEKASDRLASNLKLVIYQKIKHKVSTDNAILRIRRKLSNPFRTIPYIKEIIYNKLHRKEIHFSPKNHELDIKTIKTSDINSLEIETLLKEMKIEILLVYGGKILKKNIIQTVSTIINCHYGFTPYYKGIASSITALGDKDYRHMGATLHLIDEGIDSGAVLKYVQPDLTIKESIASILNKTMQSGMEEQIKFASELIKNKNMDSFIIPYPGKCYFSENSKLKELNNRALLRLYSGEFKNYIYNSNETFVRKKPVAQRIRKKFSAFNIGNYFSSLENGVYIVLYHHVTSQLDNDTKILGRHFLPHMTTHPSIFQKHLNYYQNNFEIVSLDKSMEILKNSGQDLNNRYMAITFDDGYKSVIENAIPIMEGKNVPYTIFINGDPVLRNRGNYLMRLSKLIEINGLDLVATFNKKFKKTYNNSEEIINDLIWSFNYDSYMLIHELWDEHASEELKILESKAYIKINDLQNLNLNLADVGSHTYSHGILSKISFEDQKKEIIECHLEIEKKLGKLINHFAYPRGAPYHFNFDSELLMSKLPHVSAYSAYGSGRNILYRPTNILRFAIGNQSTERLNIILSRENFTL